MNVKWMKWGALGVLWLVSGFVCLPQFTSIAGFWDDGNLLYPVVALAHGLILNVDVVHGYPGLHALELYAASLLGGDPLVVFRVMTWATVMLGHSFVYLVALDLMGIGFASLVFLWALSWTFGVFYTLNPAYTVYAMTAFCAYYFYREFKKSQLNGTRLNRWLWIVTAGLCGLSLGFKQSGIFNVLAYAMILAWCLRPFRSVTLWWAVRIALVLVPLALFVVLRLSSQIEVIPWNGIVILPWVLIAVTVLLSKPFPGALLSFSEVVLYGGTCIVSSFLWLLYYIGNRVSPLEVIREIYVRIPSLIDRDISPVMPSYLFISVGCLLLIHFLLRSWWSGLRRMTEGLYVNNVLLMIYAIFCASLGAFAIFRPISYSPWLSNMYWCSGFFFTVIAIRGLWLSRRGVQVEVLPVFIFYSVFAASGYPYINNLIFSNGFLALTIVYSLWLFLKNGRKQNWSRVVESVATAVAIASFVYVGLLRKADMELSPSRYLPTIGYNLYLRPPETLFVWTGEWIARFVPQNKTVGGYPNFALSLALANRISYSKLANFIGDSGDYDKIVADLLEGRGPDYFLISPTMYPYSHPYLIPPEKILKALEKGYEPYGRVAEDVNSEIRIYRKR